MLKYVCPKCHNQEMSEDSYGGFYCWNCGYCHVHTTPFRVDALARYLQVSRNSTGIEPKFSMSHLVVEDEE